MISAIVLTKNEEKKIKQCLSSIAWCDEIIIVDDFSQDKTLKETQNLNLKSQNYKLKIKIFQRHLNGNFAEQRNFGLSKAKGEWVLFIDADEYVTPQLRDEIKYQISLLRQDYAGQAKIHAYYLKRKDKFLGRWLKQGETARVKLVRLAKKGSGFWQGLVHEEWRIKGKVGELKNPLIHKRNLTMTQFLERINKYSSLRAGELYKKRIKTNAFWIIAYPAGKFLQNYVLRLGFLDGVPGLMMAMIMSFHSFLVRAKLYLLFSSTSEVKD